MTDRDLIRNIRKRIMDSKKLVVLTGAGISAESGVPTFRGEGGLWRSYRATDLATPQAFSKNPVLVWEFYLWRRRLISKCKPNPAHLALAGFESYKPVLVITQNIDGLHQKAGSRNVLEIHGSIWRVRCVKCGRLRDDDRLEMDLPPVCSLCGGLERPDVVWFGESLDEGILKGALDALMSAEVLLIVGTSGVVEPAASFGRFAASHGAYVVEVNLERTPQSPYYACTILGRAGEVLPELLTFEEISQK
ncbi:SIR2 family NAD-dependent protein deacylase [Thermodesulforhabdus norvegica]|uniref:NAD-dependent protein deacylase n=1 Tax=Thermodesulforhabdus norvegica TaxID=39841 RepID=A0A1I4VDG9_9BACT|nr:NAD-dependent deacylase [Thermodesulforhabdus norvegica]SFM99237.1 NAD-dependent deacetylase [Thermodesulforhabdus norvegica]